MLTTIEKIILLQEVDVFNSLLTEDLAYIASISEEVSIQADGVIFKEGGIPDSMYLVLEGKIRLHQNQQEVMIAEKNGAFGTWSLFDDQPRVVTATALEDSRLLRIDRDDFVDLLADHVRITQGIMKALVDRMRGLMTRVTHK
jgi:CRP-like cAMP-binding protein